MALPAKARALVAGTVGLGAGLVAVAAASGAPAPLATLALLAAAVVLTELIQVSADESSIDPADEFSFSFSSGVHVAAILLVGPLAAALVAAFGVVAVDRLRGEIWPKIAFNASAFALATAGGGLAFGLLGGEPGALSLPADFPALAALALAYSVINTGLVSAVVAFSAGLSPLAVARESVRVEAASSAGETGLGVAVAVCALAQPWAIAALVPLMLAVYLAHARLALLRRETARALETFANVVDERDPYTFRHSERVAGYVRELGEALRLPAPEVARLAWAGRLHDLGKISVDAAVLRKETRLDAAEWASLRRHPRLSARLLRPFRFATGEARAVEYHHERFDGQGYYGADSRRIPLASHFLVVADSYDAMTTDRPYRAGLAPEAALAEIESCAGSQFHPAVAKAFAAVRRGADPLAVLTAEEIAELRALTLRPAGRRLRERALRSRPELAAALGTVGGLFALGLGLLPIGLAGLGLAAAGLAWRERELRHSRSLARSLRGALAGPRPRLTVLDDLAGRLHDASSLRFAGLVAWREDELAGSLELQWSGSSERPTEAALTSWLVRDGGGADDLLVVDGAELGGEGAHLAVRLPEGYLVLAFAHSLPRHVELALRTCAEELGRVFAGRPLAPVTPGLRRAAS